MAKITPENIRNWFLAATSSVVVFLLIGYIIVESFIPAVRLEGMFWFSQEFYAKAGADFLLDVARATLFNPLFVFIWTAFLLLLFKQVTLGVRALSKNEASASILLSTAISLVATISAVIMINSGALFDPWMTRQEIVRGIDHGFLEVGTTAQLLLNIPAYHPLLPAPAVWVHINLFLPIAAVLGWELWHSRDTLRAVSAVFTITSFLCVLNFVVFIFAYGYNIYDWKVAPVDVEHINSVLGTIINLDQAEIVETQCVDDSPNPEDCYLTNLSQPEAFLLARLSDGFFFWVKDDPFDRGRIVSLSHAKVPTVSFRIEQAYSLRRLRIETEQPIEETD